MPVVKIKTSDGRGERGEGEGRGERGEGSGERGAGRGKRIRIGGGYQQQEEQEGVGEIVLR